MSRRRSETTRPLTDEGGPLSNNSNDVDSSQRSRPARGCPDCLVAGAEAHAATCPVARALDAALLDDRRWFRAHTGITARRRRVTWAERVFVGVILGEPALARSPKAAKVRVSAPTPGVRCRHIGSVYLLDVDRGAEATFAQLQRDLGMLPTTRRYVSPAGSGAVYSARGGEPL